MKIWTKFCLNVSSKRGGFLAALFLLIGSISAAAGGVTNAQLVDSLQAWKAETSELVSQAMRSPRSFKSLQDSHQVVEMLVRHDGTIVSAELVQRGSESTVTTPETKAALNRLGRLPELPVDFASELVRVRMNLIYANSKQGRDRLMAQINRHHPRQPLQLLPGGISIIEVAASH